jgi:hypothetical protein
MVRGCLILVVGLLALVGAQRGSAQVGGECSVAAATPLVQPTDPNTNGRDVARVYCGAFLGPGSQAMVAVVASEGGCVSIGGWEAFVLIDGAWQPSADGYHEVGLDGFSVHGTTIVEEVDVHRRNDWAACSATGGSRTQAWDWDGSKLAPGPWTPARPPEPRGEVEKLTRDPNNDVGVGFYVAKQPIICTMNDGRLVGVYCQSGYSTVRLAMSGRSKICLGVASDNRCGVGNPGEGDITHTLHDGQFVIIGRFRCAAERRGIRCVVIKSGRGFVIDRHVPRRV